MNIYSRLTQKKDDSLLYEENILKENGRLTDEGMRLFVDMLFKGVAHDEARSKIIEEIKKARKERKI